jgi:hypothetical protein
MRRRVAGISATMLSDCAPKALDPAQDGEGAPAILEQHALGDFDLKALRIESP